MTTYLFHRLVNGEPFFYPVALIHEMHLVEHIVLNPGTLKVTDLAGNVIWSLQ